MDTEWFSELEVISILGVTRQSVYNLRQKNKLSAFKYKGKLRYLKADVDAYVLDRNTPQLQNQAVTTLKPEHRETKNEQPALVKLSYEISLFKNGGGVPAHLRRKELSEATKALMGGGQGKRLSIRGGVFRMIVNGQEVMRSEDRAMNIIIVAAAPKTSRHWYQEEYQEGDIVKPDCWSNDGEKPDEASELKQSNTCLTCPQNIAGFGKGDSRACRYLHRLAVVLENDLHSGDIYGLSLASTSLFGKGDAGKMSMMQYAKLLGGHGMDVSDVVTEMRFDTDSATPKLTFTAVRPLDEEEIETIIEYSESEEAQQAISFTDISHEVVEKQP